MRHVTRFFWFCSGSDPRLIEQSSVEHSRYFGIGATVFFTGVFAALAAGYFFFTVFDSILISICLGTLWGLMIFNLDRYIVSSMRKEGRPFKEFAMALPRLVLAILISLVIAKPIELRIFSKEIEGELLLMEQEAFARQEQQVRVRFDRIADSLQSEIELIDNALASREQRRDALMQIAREEADGTGGSRIKNLGPIYKIKKQEADNAQRELDSYRSAKQPLREQLMRQADSVYATSSSTLQNLNRQRMDGPAARLEAMDRLSARSNAVAIAHWFIVLLFIAVETAPLFVKLIGTRAPYDNLLRVEEHRYRIEELEQVAGATAAAKKRQHGLDQKEQEFFHNRLDAELKRS